MFLHILKLRLRSWACSVDRAGNGWLATNFHQASFCFLTCYVYSNSDAQFSSRPVRHRGTVIWDLNSWIVKLSNLCVFRHDIKTNKFTFFVCINPLTPELNPSAQPCLPKFFTGILICKWLTSRRLYKSFGVKGLRYILHTVHTLHVSALHMAIFRELHYNEYIEIMLKILDQFMDIKYLS
jgi:hypothetical protein